MAAASAPKSLAAQGIAAFEYDMQLEVTMASLTRHLPMAPSPVG